MLPTRTVLLSLSLASTFVGVFLPAAQNQPKAKQVVPPGFEKDVLPTLKKFCFPCHSGKTPASGLDFSKFKTGGDLFKAQDIFERIARNVSAGTMPPEGMPKPAAAQREAMVRWIDTALSSAQCQVQDVGRVTIRRLNRNEYKNTIRDLIGVEAELADDFPNDDVGYGFDNIGDVLSTSPLLMEKYLDSAEKIAQKAIVDFHPKKTVVDATLLPRAQGANDLDGRRLLFTQCEIGQDFPFAETGNYVIRVRAAGQQAGPEPCKMALRVEARTVETFLVKATEGSPGIYEAPVHIDKGDRHVSVAFTNDFYNSAATDPANRDRNLIIYWLEIEGPLMEMGRLPDSHRRIIPEEPSGDPRIYARTIIQKLADRAYRRPATSDEVDRLLAVFDLAAKEKESFERGIQLALEAILVSPNFLFRVEKNGAPGAPIDGYELASRLSYFLWSSMPDDRLLALAGEGALSKPQVVREEVLRMLKDPRAETVAENFGGQWLQVRKLAVLAPDAKLFPEFNGELRDAMAKETTLFFDSIRTENRSVVDFIDANYSFVNEQLARLYGMPGVSGKEFRKVSLEGTSRAGVLTQASILTITSNPNRTSPTKRGRWVLEQILGTPPPPPPPGAGALVDNAASTTGLTLRKQLEMHRKNPECASCHARMDPLGFSLENFNPIGGWRTEDQGKPLDTSGSLPDGTKLNSPLELKKLLVSKKDQFVRNFVEKLMTFALGRGVDDVDRCAVDTILKNTKPGKYRFADIVAEIAISDPFRKRGAERSPK